MRESTAVIPAQGSDELGWFCAPPVQSANSVAMLLLSGWR
jgi:hypothetical protein